MIVDLEAIGPYPCECGGEASIALAVVIESRRQFVLASRWFCPAHASEAVARYVALVADGYVVGLFDRSEALDALREMDAALREHATVIGDVEFSDEFDNRAARRARARRHNRHRRGRYNGRVA